MTENPMFFWFFLIFIVIVANFGGRRIVVMICKDEEGPRWHILFVESTNQVQPGIGIRSESGTWLPLPPTLASMWETKGDKRQSNVKTGFQVALILPRHTHQCTWSLSSFLFQLNFLWLFNFDWFIIKLHCLQTWFQLSLFLKSMLQRLTNSSTGFSKLKKLSLASCNWVMTTCFHPIPQSPTDWQVSKWIFFSSFDASGWAPAAKRVGTNERWANLGFGSEKTICVLSLSIKLHKSLKIHEIVTHWLSWQKESRTAQPHL